MNPFTGEILPEPVEGVIDRRKSIWGPNDPPTRKGESNRDEAVIQNMTSFIPENYASRAWGRRLFDGFNSEEMAANHIKTVFRGYRARKRLQAIFQTRFTRIMDRDSGFYYFHDSLTDESLWHKPLLANPDDVPLEDPFKYHLPTSMNANIYKATTGQLRFNDERYHQDNVVYDGQDDGLIPSPSKSWAGHGEKPLVPTCVSECLIDSWPFMVIRSWFDRYSSSIASLAPFRLARERKDWLSLVELFNLTRTPAAVPPTAEAKMDDAGATRPGSKHEASTPRPPRTPTPRIPGSPLGHMDSLRLADGWHSPPGTASSARTSVSGHGRGLTLRASRSGGRQRDPEVDLAALHKYPKAHQLYALYCMNYLPILDPQNLDSEGKPRLMRGVDDAVGLIVDAIKTSLENKGPFSLLDDVAYKTFFFYVLSNALDAKGGRHSFFATPDIDDKYGSFGPTWEKEREDEIVARSNALARMLRFIPTECVRFRSGKKEGGEVTTLMVATRDGSELAESILLALGMLAREADYTDLVSLGCADEVVTVMPKVVDDVGPSVAALRCLYNCCFMNEMGQMAVLGAEAEAALTQYRAAGIGRDPEVMRECRRLELALEKDGWRGRVEAQMTEEFHHARAESRARKKEAQRPSKGHRVDPMDKESSTTIRSFERETSSEERKDKSGEDLDHFMSGWDSGV